MEKLNYVTVFYKNEIIEPTEQKAFLAWVSPYCLFRAAKFESLHNTSLEIGIRVSEESQLDKLIPHDNQRFVE